MATKVKQHETAAAEILKAEKGRVIVRILGKTPLIHNRMSQKAWRQLLAPSGRKTSAEKNSTMKHNPIQEFRDSPYLISDPNAPALLSVMPTVFKKAMESAAIDMPGAKKAVIGRLVYVDGQHLPIYGVPRVFMSITRSADIKRTPDVKTRAICPEWACQLDITFTKPMLREQGILNLLGAAGYQSGIGDWRQQKGSGNYGCFELVRADNEDWNRIVETQGRAAQQEALDNPVCFDAETEELLSWFEVEKNRRGFKAVA